MTGRLQSLRDRYFPSPDEEAREVQQEVEQSAVRRGKILGFVTHEYAEEFKLWLRDQMRAWEPKPGDHTQMIYQSGMRDGLRLVLEHLDSLVDSCRRQDG